MGIVFDRRHAITLRLNQSLISTRDRKPFASGLKVISAWLRPGGKMSVARSSKRLRQLMDHRRVYPETARQLRNRLLALQGLRCNPCLEPGPVLLALRHRQSLLLEDQQTPTP